MYNTSFIPMQEPFHDEMADPATELTAWLRLAMTEGIGPVLDTLTARWFTDEFCAARPDVIDWRKAQVMSTDADVFLNVFDIHKRV